MFYKLPDVPRDPIVGLMAEVLLDDNPQKIDLGAGVYRGPSGITPIFDAVRVAERRIIDTQLSKTYTKQKGPDGALEILQRLILGGFYDEVANRMAGTVTAGGTAAIRLGAELVRRSNSDVKVWISNPSWSNHERIFRSLGFDIGYYDFLDSSAIEFSSDILFHSLSPCSEGDLVVLHGCCHNPTGVDPSPEKWKELSTFLSERKLLPFVDLAYQGFGESLTEDVMSVHFLTQACERLIVASSCSKNFGLYRERVGALSVKCNSIEESRVVQDNINNITRVLYSFPPAHGALVVHEVLRSSELRLEWENELMSYVRRIRSLKEKLVNSVLGCSGGRLDLSGILQQKGMFAYLGVGADVVSLLQSKYSIYMTQEGRINVTGLSESSIDQFAQALCDVHDMR